MRLVRFVCSLAAGASVAGPLHAQSALSSTSTASSTSAPDSLVTVPANTRIFARLERQFSTRHEHAGDTLYLRTVHPVLVGNRVVIPSGTFIESTLAPNSERGSEPLNVALHIDRLVFSNGYVATPSIDGRAVANDSSYEFPESPTNEQELIEGVIAPATGGAFGAMLGAASGVAHGGDFGAGIGALAGMVIAAVAMHGHADHALAAESPVDLELASGLTLDLVRASSAMATGDDAFAAGAAHAVACRRATITIPDSPPTVIPGTASTPAIGDIPAVPGTPDIIIPGTAGRTIVPRGCP